MATSLQARPEFSRQLDHDDLLAFWRSREGAGREGLVGMVDFCRNRDCLCADVSIDCERVDERLREVRLDRGAMRLAFAAGAAPPPTGGLIRIVLDVEAGAARVDETDAARVGAEEIMAWIHREADGELLDALHARWSRGRGFDPRRRVLPEVPEPGEMVFWSEVYPSAREDCYLDGDRRYLLGEMFCVEEGCECEDVRFVVWDVTDGEDDDDVGSWLIDTDGGIEWTLSSTPKETLHQIWATYQRRHRAADRLAAHRADVRAAVAQSRQLLAEASGAGRAVVQALTAAKIPRNAQCPCGSGKKYKKCCGA